MKVDIVIPIYNAFEDVRLCLESIYRHTSLQQNRLILINDNSSDERIRPFLDAQENENVIVIHNEKNRGFSNNINLGMSQSLESDVILLNSDTVVTSHWIEKMFACAYSNRSIGTVTPLSNNATLCSVPVFCEENLLPQGMTVDHVAQIVEECSLKKYPRITVAHGFCMFIKREVIRTIGYFDAAAFGRGYGEENDFCNRAEQVGYIHVMCDDTYIYHSGTKSFVSKEKENYIREHEKILRKRYPRQMRANDLHCQMNPNHFVGENISLYLDLYNGKRNILYLLQSDFREGSSDNVGGTQLHVKQLTYRLRKDMNVFVAARNRDYLQLTAYTNANEYMFRFYIGEPALYPVSSNKEIAAVLHRILSVFKIDLVHVHHTVSTSLDIFYEAEKMGIPIFFTVHDFYFACPTVKLLECGEKVCVGKDAPNCKLCLDKHLGITDSADYLQLWHCRHGEVLAMCRKIITPSASAKDIFLQFYPECNEKVHVIPHGADKQEVTELNKTMLQISDHLDWTISRVDAQSCCICVSGTVKKVNNEPVNKVLLLIRDRQGKEIFVPANHCEDIEEFAAEKTFYAALPNSMLAEGNLEIFPILSVGGKYMVSYKKPFIQKNIKAGKKEVFRVAFIGGINRDKGGERITQIIRQGSREIQWYVFGGIGEETLADLKQENLVKTGYYAQEDLATLLKYHKINAICLLSMCPETFSYTLSEAILNRIPVIVTDVGALADRVREIECGKVVSLERVVEEVIATVALWKDKGVEYQTALDRVQKYVHPDINKMAQECKLLYQEEFQENNRQTPDNNKEDYEFLYQSCETFHGNGDDSELRMQFKQMQEYIRVIDSSVSFRIVRKAANMKIPFRRQIRVILKKLLKQE